VPGFRGGYVPAGFHDGSITDGIVTFELERQMWAPMYSRSLRRQRALAGVLGIAVRTHPGLDLHFHFMRHGSFCSPECHIR
jgi:hypothetical protein